MTTLCLSFHLWVLLSGHASPGTFVEEGTLGRGAPLKRGCASARRKLGMGDICGVTPGKCRAEEAGRAAEASHCDSALSSWHCAAPGWPGRKFHLSLYCVFCDSLWISTWPQHPALSFSSHPEGLWGPSFFTPCPRSQTLHLHLPAIASVYPKWHSA